MAPALVENAVPDIRHLTLKQSGHNKEGFIGSPLEFNKDGELKGTAHQPAASFPNYLPVWDNETSK
jgi:sulfonate dioxygenase